MHLRISDLTKSRITKFRLFPSKWEAQSKELHCTKHVLAFEMRVLATPHPPPKKKEKKHGHIRGNTICACVVFSFRIHEIEVETWYNVVNS